MASISSRKQEKDRASDQNSSYPYCHHDLLYFTRKKRDDFPRAVTSARIVLIISDLSPEKKIFHFIESLLSCLLSPLRSMALEQKDLPCVQEGRIVVTTRTPTFNLFFTFCLFFVRLLFRRRSSPGAFSHTHIRLFLCRCYLCTEYVRCLPYYSVSLLK